MVPVSTLGVIDFALRSLIYTKFGSFLSLPSVDSGVIFQPKEVAQREFAEKQGKVQSNFVSVWRSNTQFSWDRQRTAMGRKGTTLQYTSAGKTSTIIATAVPVDLIYDMRVWALSLEAIQQLTEEYLFWIHNNPNLDIELDGYPITPNIHFKNVDGASLAGDMYKIGKYWTIDYTMNMDAWVVRFNNLPTVQGIVLKGFTGEPSSRIQVFQKNFP